MLFKKNKYDVNDTMYLYHGIYTYKIYLLPVDFDQLINGVATHHINRHLHIYINVNRHIRIRFDEDNRYSRSII